MRSPLVKLCTPYMTQKEVKYSVTLFARYSFREREKRENAEGVGDYVVGPVP